MKRLTLIPLMFALVFGAKAQTNNTPPPTIQSGVQLIIDAMKSGMTNWDFEAHGLYAPGLTKKAGGGIGAFYPISQYVLTGIRLDYVNGGFWMPSGNATFQVPLQLAPWLRITPLGYLGAGVPVSGAVIGGTKLPGTVPKDNNGQLTGIIGYGLDIHLWSNAAKTWSVGIVADRETWTGFSGSQYRFGIGLNHLF